MRDEVFDRLLDAIVAGDLEPGEQLHDAEIEKWAGASRTPVREALNQLASAGLVDVLPQSKTRVAPIDVPRVLGIIGMLQALLHGVVRDAVPLLTPGDLKALRSVENEFSRTKKPGEQLRELVMSGELSSVFIRRLDNATVSRLAARQAPSVRRAVNASPLSVDRGIVSGVLGEIAAACVAGDGVAAAAAMDRYFTEILAPLVDALDSSPADAGERIGARSRIRRADQNGAN